MFADMAFMRTQRSLWDAFSAAVDAAYLAGMTFLGVQLCVQVVGASGMSMLVPWEMLDQVNEHAPAFHIATQATCALAALAWLRSRRLRAVCDEASHHPATFVVPALGCAVAGTTFDYRAVAILFVILVALWPIAAGDMLRMAVARGPRWLVAVGIAGVIGWCALSLVEGVWSYWVGAVAFGCRAVALTGRTWAGESARYADGSWWSRCPFSLHRLMDAVRQAIGSKWRVGGGDVARPLPVPGALLALLPVLLFAAVQAETVGVLLGTASMSASFLSVGSAFGTVVGPFAHSAAPSLLRGASVALPALAVIVCWKCVAGHVGRGGALLALASVGVLGASATMGGYGYASLEQGVPLVVIAGTFFSAAGNLGDGNTERQSVLSMLPAASSIAGLLSFALHLATQRDSLSCLVCATVLLGTAFYSSRRRDGLLSNRSIAEIDGSERRSSGCGRRTGVNTVYGARSESTQRDMFREIGDRWGLSDGETQVVAGMYDGLSLAEIARERGVSKSTVASYGSRAYAKLGVSGRREAVELVGDALRGVGGSGCDYGMGLPCEAPKDASTGGGRGRCGSALRDLAPGLFAACAAVNAVATGLFAIMCLGSGGSHIALRFVVEQVPVALTLFLVVVVARIGETSEGVRNVHRVLDFPALHCDVVVAFEDDQPFSSAISWPRRLAIFALGPASLSLLLAMLLRPGYSTLEALGVIDSGTPLLSMRAGVDLLAALALVASTVSCMHTAAGATVRAGRDGGAAWWIAIFPACALALVAQMAGSFPWTYAVLCPLLVAVSAFASYAVGAGSRGLARQDAHLEYAARARVDRLDRAVRGISTGRRRRPADHDDPLPVSFGVSIPRLVGLILLGLHLGCTVLWVSRQRISVVVEEASLVILAAVIGFAAVLVCVGRRIVHPAARTRKMAVWEGEGRLASAVQFFRKRAGRGMGWPGRRAGERFYRTPDDAYIVGTEALVLTLIVVSTARCATASSVTLDLTLCCAPTLVLLGYALHCRDCSVRLGTAYAGAMTLPLTAPLIVGAAYSPFTCLFVELFADTFGQGALRLFALTYLAGSASLLLCLRSYRLRSALVRSEMAVLIEVARGAGLSDAESRVAVAYARGLSVSAVAAERVVSVNTAKAQLRSAYRKLDIHSRDELTAKLEGLVRDRSESV